MATYQEVVECGQRDLEITLAECYARGAFAIEEQDLPGNRLRLLVYYHEPIDGAQAVDESVDWQSVSEQPWKAIPIGSRLWLAPPWVDEDPPDGRMRLNYIRGQACGTGGHAATQACLLAMDKHLRPGESFLDVGCGSGILCLAADLLDAGDVAGCDIDYPSVVIAAKHSHAPLFTGSTRSVRPSTFDVIAANVNATVVANIADDLSRILKPGGRVIAGGFKTGETPPIRLSLVDRCEVDGWCAAVYSH